MCVHVWGGLSFNIVKLLKNPNVSVEVLHTHTFFFFTPSSNISPEPFIRAEQGQRVCFKSFWSHKQIKRGSPLERRSHNGLLRRCVRACFSGNGFWLNTSIRSEGEKGELVKLLALLHMSQFSEVAVLVLRFKSRCWIPAVLFWTCFIGLDVIFQVIITMYTPQLIIIRRGYFNCISSKPF